MSRVHVIFRDRDPVVADAFARAIDMAAQPFWDVQCGDIFHTDPADFIVSPANCIGRMDGGIDAAYVHRFGWQLQARLCHHLLQWHGGRVEIGAAIGVPTGSAHIPIMLMAPTMDWPPGPVPDTDNAYLAFRAAMQLAHGVGREVRVLTPGLCTLTGRMPPARAAEQMVRAWKEVCL